WDELLPDRVAGVSWVGDDEVERLDLVADELVDPVELTLCVVVGGEVPSHGVAQRSQVCPAVTPPSTRIVAPVTYDDSDEGRNSCTAATSSGSPQRLSAVMLLTPSYTAADVSAPALMPVC